jgi:ABC-type polysaccharide/polyol phosphate export permease
MKTWNGDYGYVLQNLIAKDFRVRYRNMSLGIFWSLLNPLIMMTVLTFIFTRILVNTRQTEYPVFVLCGLIPFNFLALSWGIGTSCIVENTPLIKRTTFPKELIPIASVLSNCLHLLIQIGLLLTLVLAFGNGVNRYWLWLPFVWGFEVLLTCGLVFVCGALSVYIRDMRYVVDATCTVLFWLVPIFYPFSAIPDQYKNVYQFNPVAAIVLALRYILLENTPPPSSLLTKLAFGSTFIFVVGWFVFQRAKQRFYDYL